MEEQRLSTIEILEGHQGSACFRIMPVALPDEGLLPGAGDEVFTKALRRTAEEISIDEDDVEMFLFYFLKRNYNQKRSMLYRRLEHPEPLGVEFEWNLEDNVYSYDEMRRMLAEMRETAARLVLDYDDPSLAGVKERFRASAFVHESVSVWDMTPVQEQVFIPPNIAVATDFYERFARRMELMMARAPQFSDVSFTGP